MWKKRYRTPVNAGGVGAFLLAVGLIFAALLGMQAGVDDWLERSDQLQRRELRERELRRAEREEWRRRAADERSSIGLDSGDGRWTEDPDGRGGSFTLPRWDTQ